MKTIYKYTLYPLDEQEIELPKWCTPLSVQMQNGDIQMWALVDKRQPLVKATVKIIDTGEDITVNFYLGAEHHTYLGTVQDRSFVWHVFITGSFTSQS